MRIGPVEFEHMQYDDYSDIARRAGLSATAAETSLI